MTQRTQIALPAEDHRRAKAKAGELGISLAEYIRRLVAADVETAPRTGQVEALFALGTSADESDIATHKDAYLGDAVASQSARR